MSASALTMIWSSREGGLEKRCMNTCSTSSGTLWCSRSEMPMLPSAVITFSETRKPSLGTG